MFAREDEEYLIRKLGRNEVVLFLGAGFSSGAKSRNGDPLPIGGQLATLTWQFLGYDDPYDDTPLAELYDALLRSGKGHHEIKSFLEGCLLTKEVPAWYDAVTRPFWYRVYTTNVDDVLERVYTRSTQRLEILSYPDDDVSERDQFLQRIQAIYLNGRLPCSPTQITFSASQYARAAGKASPLYEQFVRDYATHCMLFVGTKLNEPLLWQAVEARRDRAPEDAEFRPKSFLFAPKIPPVKRELLATYNIVPVEASVETLMEWIESKASELPTRLEVLRHLEPTLISLIDTVGALQPDLPQLQEFSSAFHRVSLPEAHRTDRSLFLLGASPRWEDLYADLDAPRDLTDEILGAIRQLHPSDNAVNVIAILGSAGSGKSTILRRLGIRLMQAGTTAYLTNSECLPHGRAAVMALQLHRDRVVLLFDNAEVALPWLPELVDNVSTLGHPPVVVLACRTNDFDRLSGKFPDSMVLREYPVPNLNRREICAVLSKLERAGLLGCLQGLSLEAQIREFEGPAKRQILVAMREATSGRGFDQIIQDEFDTLTPAETKLLYLCVALATDAGYRLSKDEFVGCSTVGAAAALNILLRSLRDIVFATGSRDDLLLLRHRKIAEHVASVGAPRPLLRDAYIRLLSVLAGKVQRRPWRSREFSMYRSLINHKTIYERFSSNIEEARAIYQSLVESFNDEPQFWLQFGNLELEGRGGSLEFAENYISQASSLAPHDSFVRNARAHVLLRKATEADYLSVALSLREQGSLILEDRMHETGLADAYAIHIYCSQRFKWMRKWYYLDDEAQLSELEAIRSVLEHACKIHFRHRRLASLRQDIEKAYLQMAMPRAQREDILVDV